MTRRSTRAALGALATLLVTGGLTVAATPAGAVVTATVATGDLVITADAADGVAVTCDAGNVKVNGDDPTPATACAAIDSIDVTATGAFANVIDLSAVSVANGFTAVAAVAVDAGAGDDLVTGSTLADQLEGGDGNDRIIGFRGNDTMAGQVGDDTLVWNNGDASDVIEGGDGADTTEVNGSDAAGDSFTIVPSTLTPGRVAFDRVNLVPFNLDILTERLDVNGQGGDDTISSSQGTGPTGLAALISLDLDGGAGNDAVVGGDGADLLAGGAGNDVLTGFRGADTVAGGDGDDTMIWNNGDGSDVNDGGAGNDAVQVNGSNAAGDDFTLKPSTVPGGLRFDRTNLVPFSIEFTAAELLDLRDSGNAAGVGTDTFAATGTAGVDVASVSPGETTGLGVRTLQTGFETVSVDFAAGDDRVQAQAGPARLLLEGGAGTDVLTVDAGGQIVTTSDILVGNQEIIDTGFERVGFVNSAPRGYWLVGQNGAVRPFGSAPTLGDASTFGLSQPLVGGANTASGLGYWLLGRDGGVFSFGDAQFFGSTGNLVLNQPVVGMAPTPTGLGYWFVAADGGIFAYGDARYFGSMGGSHLNQPIVGMASTPTGQGYWLVARDGGIFAFGDARFFGSTGDITLNQPIVGMTGTLDGLGYRFVAADGGVFSFGSAPFFGSTGGQALSAPIVGMTATPTGDGYWFVGRNGAVYEFGDAPDLGSAVGSGIAPVAGIIGGAL